MQRARLRDNKGKEPFELYPQEIMALRYITAECILTKTGSPYRSSRLKTIIGKCVFIAGNLLQASCDYFHTLL